MKSILFSVDFAGPITLERCEGIKPYPVRNLMLQEHGKWKYERIYCKASFDDALLDLQKGDLLQADLAFYVCKKRGKWHQTVRIRNIVKLN
jgi:hypothetical protein